MTPYTRADRVGGLIQQALSDIILRKVKDPRLNLATITGVKLTRDLKIARVYFSIPGGPDKAKDASSGFNSAAGYIKVALARQIELRYMPDLEFYYDESFDYGSKIDKLLKSIQTDS